MRQKINRLLISLAVFIASITSSLIIFPSAVSAGDNCAPEGIGGFVLPTWHKYLQTAGGTCEVTKFDVPGDIWKVALALVEIVLRVGGLVAMIFVIYGGFKYVLSKGNPSDAAKARQTIIDAAIGVGIASLATVLIAFLGKELTK